MNKFNLSKIVFNSLNFLERESYYSYDFFDALTSPLLNKISNQFLRRVIIQLNGRSLINFRPILGIKKKVHTKTVSDLLSIYSFLNEKKNNIDYLNRCNYFYNLLINKKIETSDKISWGLNFTYTSRFVSSSASTPNLFNTINSTLALLDYYDIVKKDEIFFIINNVLNFIFSDLGLVAINNKQKWLRYYPEQTVPTYNVNALAAYTFLRINNTFGQKLINNDIIFSLINFLINEQNKDGSWYYSASPNGRWIDGFHSGYIIESLSYLKLYDYVSNDIFEKSVEFYINNLISKDGVPKYYNKKMYPIEAQNCAQAIQTVAKLIINNNFLLKELLDKMVNFTIENLYNEKGYFYYKKEKYFTNKNIFFRWSVTPMVLALLYADEAINKGKS